MRTQVSVRLPEQLALDLEGIARDTERAKSYHVQKALEMYMRDFADLQAALDRLKDPTDPVVSLEEMRRKLEV